jgi:uncharacterized protein
MGWTAIHYDMSFLTPSFLDLLLIMALGFLGSFGHCVGMCGPLAVALSLSADKTEEKHLGRSLLFHSLLNLGRIASYTLVGAAIGAVGSVLVAGGQLAGIDSTLRQAMTLLTGSLMIWMGLVQVAPALLPKIPLLRPMHQGGLHRWLNAIVRHASAISSPFTPLLLGLTWGLIPCGFLYAAQIKAAAAGNVWGGAVTMLAFGLGTVPAMVGTGLSATLMSADRRGQLFRMGGWVMLAIGVLMLLRTGEMVDYTGHAALVMLMLALVARPLGQLIPWLLRYRRGMGVGAFGLAVAHTAHMLDHAFAWRLDAIAFLLPLQQVGMGAGGLAMGCLLLPALTSCDRWMRQKWWRWVHWLAVPALVLGAVHTILMGSRYLGNLEWTMANQLHAGILLGVTLGVFLVRSRFIWAILSVEQYYGSPR